MSDLDMRNLSADSRLETSLRNFFRAEMPSPWPALQLPPEAPRRRSLLQGMASNGGRFAIAASLAAFILCYLALTAAFPPSKSNFAPHGENISLKGDGTNTPRLPVIPR